MKLLSKERNAVLQGSENVIATTKHLLVVVHGKEVDNENIILDEV